MDLGIFKKAVAFILGTVLLFGNCCAFADDEFTEGYRGLNAQEAHEYFKEIVVPAKLKAARPGTWERKAWKIVNKKKLKLVSEYPSKKNTRKLVEKRIYNISDQLKPYAVEKYYKAIGAEPEITRDVIDAARAADSGVYGMSRRIKNAGENEEGVCRIADKIRENVENAKKAGKSITYEQAVDKLDDLIRYTVACSPFGFCDEFETVVTHLLLKGYKLKEVSNTWETFTKNNPYRGVAAVFESPDGQLFEVQFQTAESYAATRITHDLYDEARRPLYAGTNTKDQLYQTQYPIYESLTVPANIGKIKNYPPKTDEPQK